MPIIKEEEFIDLNKVDWLYKPKPKESQKEFQTNFFKKYQAVFGLILIFVLLVVAVVLWEGGIFTELAELF